MSTTRLYSLLGTTSIFLRNYKSKLSPVFAHRFSKFFPSQTLRFHRYSDSPAATINIDNVGIDIHSTELNGAFHHPWPEWVSFVDRLKAIGYFPDDCGGGGDGNEAGESTGSDGVFYTDMNLLKDGCLEFGRDRFDILKSLSRQDVQTIVEKGCPNLFRKAVNSAKRLRAYVHLDEGDVCSACSLRGSCDRAYVILQEYEAVARLVDVLRILLFYALDPLVISGGEKPLGRELIEASARKLLSELTLLSETNPDPVAVKATKQEKRSLDDKYSRDVEMKRGDWICSTKQEKRSLDVMDDKYSQDVEMKRGDWICPKCNFMNFAKNLGCLKCQEDRPKQIDGKKLEMKKGDWICSQCNFMNFSRNIRCLECEAERPMRVDNVAMKKGDWNCPPMRVDNVAMKKGDWNCPGCGFMNFARNMQCRRCRQESRPEGQLIPGEWKCSS